MLIKLSLLVIGLLAMDSHYEAMPPQGKQKSEYKYVLCKEINNELLTKLKVSEKMVHNGAILVMTSADPMIVGVLKTLLVRCRNLDKLEWKNQPKITELLKMMDIKIELAFLNNGVKLELRAEKPVLIKKIHRLSLTSYGRKENRRYY